MASSVPYDFTIGRPSHRRVEGKFTSELQCGAFRFASATRMIIIIIDLSITSGVWQLLLVVPKVGIPLLCLTITPTERYPLPFRHSILTCHSMDVERASFLCSVRLRRSWLRPQTAAARFGSIQLPSLFCNTVYSISEFNTRDFWFLQERTKILY